MSIKSRLPIIWMPDSNVPSEATVVVVGVVPSYLPYRSFCRSENVLSFHGLGVVIETIVSVITVSIGCATGKIDVGCELRAIVQCHGCRRVAQVLRRCMIKIAIEAVGSSC